MPTRERTLDIDGRDLGGDQSYQQRRHREAMARNTSPKESGLRSSNLRSSPRADAQPLPLDDAAWDHEHDEAARHRARRLLSRSSSELSPVRRQLWRVPPMARGRALGKAPRRRDRRVDGNLWRMFRGAVVAARRRPDQSRYGDAMAGCGDRGKYRPRQHRRGRRHPDRTRRPDPYRGAYPRHHRPGSRSCHRGERAKGRSSAVRHGAVDGTAARRKPQSGGCHARGTHHPGRLRHGIHRRQCAPARNRRNLEARAWRTAITGSGGADDRCSRAVSARGGRAIGCHACGSRKERNAQRHAGRPRLARQPEPDRA